MRKSFAGIAAGTRSCHLGKNGSIQSGRSAVIVSAARTVSPLIGKSPEPSRPKIPQLCFLGVTSPYAIRRPWLKQPNPDVFYLNAAADREVLSPPTRRKSPLVVFNFIPLDPNVPFS